MGGALRPLLLLSTTVLLLITTLLHMSRVSSFPLEPGRAARFGTTHLLRIQRRSATVTTPDRGHLGSLQTPHQEVRNVKRRLLQRSSATPVNPPPVDASKPTKGTKHPVPPDYDRRR